MARAARRRVDPAPGMAGHPGRGREAATQGGNPRSGEGAECVVEHVRFATPDGAELAGTWFRPARPRRVTVVHSAVCVLRGWYADFAAFLAGRGHAVLTWDPRGIGDSRAPGAWSAVTLDDWMLADFSAAVGMAEAAHASLPLCMVGHSLGGHAMLLNADGGRARAGVAVATGSGHWCHLRGRRRVERMLAMGAAVPSVALAFGGLPGWAGLGEDMPLRAALQWRRQCLQPDYFDRRQAAVIRRNMDVLVSDRLFLAFTDDAISVPAAVESVASFVPARHRRVQTVSPDAVGARSIGHLRFFRPSGGGAVWPEVAAFLEARA